MEGIDGQLSVEAQAHQLTAAGCEKIFREIASGAKADQAQLHRLEHSWFEDWAEPCTLPVFIDDASGRLMQLRFVTSESASASTTTECLAGLAG